MGTYLPPFDPSHAFVTATAFRAGGKPWGKGYVFDKSCVNQRVLRMLYEQRKIVPSDDPKAIDLMTRAGGRGPIQEPKPKGPAEAKPNDPLDHDGDGRKGGSVPETGGSEEDQVKRLMNRHGKTDLLALAKDIPGIQKSMNKTQLATALVRSGHGNS